MVPRKSASSVPCFGAANSTFTFTSSDAIGLIALQLAVKAGAAVVIGVDPIEHRREVAKKMGAHFTFDPTQCDVGLRLKKQPEKWVQMELLKPVEACRHYSPH